MNANVKVYECVCMVMYELLDYLLLKMFKCDVIHKCFSDYQEIIHS